MSRMFRKLEIAADTENLPQVLGFVESVLEEAGCPSKAQMQIAVAVEEIFVNIAHYAYGGKGGGAKVEIEVSGDCAAVTFTDSGTPFDPLEKPDPDTSIPAEEREIGGLGIFMTKKFMDDVRYEYKNGQNILNLRKYL